MKRKNIIVGILFVIFFLTVLIFMFNKEENLENISVQVETARTTLEHDITTMGDSVEDKIYDKYDVVKFGRFYQDENGKKKIPIDWIVLAKKEDKVLLLSKYILYAMPMKVFSEDEKRVYTWTNSDARKWLNKEFYYDAFNSKEKNEIITTDLENDYEKNTKDNVFLLSEKEFREYFDNDFYYSKLIDPNYVNEEYLNQFDTSAYERHLRYGLYYNGATVGTDYAFSKGLVDVRNGIDFEGGEKIPGIPVQEYWLRTATGTKGDTAFMINGFHYISIAPCNQFCLGIRPAIWVSIK